MMVFPLEGQPRWSDPKAERLVDFALAAALIPGDQIRMLRPPLPQIQEFPPLYGYRSYQDRQTRIEDVIDVPRIYSDPRVSWTGTQGGYSGSSRPSMEAS